MTQLSAPEAGSYAGAVVAIVASLTLTQWGIIVGIFTALATFGLNALFMLRRDRREERETAAKLKRIEDFFGPKDHQPIAKD